MKSLPSDTGAVLGLGFKEGWFGDIVDYVAPYAGEDADQLMSDLSDLSGLDLPADAETLAGDSAALALGSDFDPAAFSSSEDGADVPIALKIKGDPDKIEKVLDKLRDQAGPQANVLESDKDGERHRHRPERRLPRRGAQGRRPGRQRRVQERRAARPTRRRRCCS